MSEVIAMRARTESPVRFHFASGARVDLVPARGLRYSTPGPTREENQQFGQIVAFRCGRRSWPDRSEVPLIVAIDFGALDKITPTAPVEPLVATAVPGSVATSLSFVYFLLDDEASLIKIGFTRRPKGRLQTLRRHHPRDLRAIGIICGSLHDERSMHRALFGHRVANEWYVANSDVMAFVRSAIDGHSPCSTCGLEVLG